MFNFRSVSCIRAWYKCEESKYAMILQLISLYFSVSENDCSVISEVQWEKHSLTYFHIAPVWRHALSLHNDEWDVYCTSNDKNNTHQAAITELRGTYKLYIEMQQFNGFMIQSDMILVYQEKKKTGRIMARIPQKDLGCIKHTFEHIVWMPALYT